MDKIKIISQRVNPITPTYTPDGEEIREYILQVVCDDVDFRDFIQRNKTLTKWTN